MIRRRDPVGRSDRLPLVQLRVAREHVAVILSIAKPERAVEVVLALPAPRQALGLDPLEVRQVAQGGEPERLQEFPRRHIGERAPGCGARIAPSISPWRLREAMTSRLISRPANLEISPRVTGCK